MTRGDEAITLLRQHDFDVLVGELVTSGHTGLDVMTYLGMRRIQTSALLRAGIFAELADLPGASCIRCMHKTRTPEELLQAVEKAVFK